jgi:hypothetical protein
VQYGFKVNMSSNAFLGGIMHKRVKPQVFKKASHVKINYLSRYNEDFSQNTYKLLLLVLRKVLS